MMKKVLLLGSTGSIGVNTLDVIRGMHDRFKVSGLAVNKNIDELKKQVKEFSPEIVVVKNEDAARRLAADPEVTCEVLSGDAGLAAASAKADYDIFLGAVVGFSGLAPTIEAARRGKRIALANKETLVVAGEMIRTICKQSGAELLPVDSEHSAIFQCLTGEKTESVHKLILTASGGPFFSSSKSELEKVTVKDALRHPTWDMGAKITIDSATMMNKGLEVIEASWLFDIMPEKIDVVVHPQSIIHSMVEFIDGSIKAQLSTPDMRLPIQYALTWPERAPAEFVTTNFAKLGTLSFFEPDVETFECLSLAFQALATGGTAPCIVNAANEIAVDSFLKGKINFTAIPDIIKRSLDTVENHFKPDLDTIYQCDARTRSFAGSLC